MEDISKQIRKMDLKQNAIKILINSIYGAFGNKWFYFYNPDIAQSITLQGQDLIQFSIRAVNFYFKERWHLDKELHELLGIANYKISKIEDESAIYTDTDSIYVRFDSAINSIQGLKLSSDEALNICVAIDTHRLSKYFDMCFERYGAQFNTKNRLKFKLENFSEYGLWIKKKMYAIKPAYDPNPNYELIKKEKRKITVKGLEPAKGSWPIWAREKLLKIMDTILAIGKELNVENDLIPLLKEAKIEFNTLSDDDVAFNYRIRTYNKYIENISTLELKKGISIFSRATAYFNYSIIKNGLSSKYNAIREGGKIKYYHCVLSEFNEFDVFAYPPGNYPSEIAPKMDRDLQFFTLIIDPINRQLIAMGMTPLDQNLKREVEIIKLKKSKKPLTDDDIFPLYIVNRESLEYSEIPSKFWNIIMSNEDVMDNDFAEYLGIITKYGLNGTISPKCELDKYIIRLSKKKKVEDPETVEENE